MIDKIFTLSNGEKVMVLDQGCYNEKSYYFTCELDENEDLTERFFIFEESMIDGQKRLSSVKDSKIFQLLIEYFKDRVEKNN